MTALKPLKKAIVFEAATDIQLETSEGAKIAGIVCIILTLILYVVFSPLLVAG
jgi:uncharacterized sodium:solute symporter family permease YidK